MLEQAWRISVFGRDGWARRQRGDERKDRTFHSE